MNPGVEVEANPEAPVDEEVEEDHEQVDNPEEVADRVNMEEQLQNAQHAIETLQEELERMQDRDRERGSAADIPLFFGRSTDDFQTFFEQFELVANGHNWTNAQRCRKLPMRLRETAYEVYRGLPQATKNDYDLLRTALNNALRPPEVSRLKAAELHRRIQAPTGKVSAFAQGLRELARGAYPDMAAAQQEGLL